MDRIALRAPTILPTFRTYVAAIRVLKKGFEMKTWKKTLAVVLIAAMTVTAISSIGLADTGEVDLSKYTAGTGYIAFGDSITRGYAASDLWDEEGYRMDTVHPEDIPDCNQCRLVTGSYPTLLAERLGCVMPENMLKDNGEAEEATYWPVAQDAISTAFVNDLLGIDDGIWDYQYLHNYYYGLSRYNTDLFYYGDEESAYYGEDYNNAPAFGEHKYGKTGVCGSIRELIADASLITIQIGMGDVLNRSRDMAQVSVNYDFNEDTIGQALQVLLEELFNGYNMWKTNFPMILDFFKENMKNSESEVVIIGAINPIYNMNISSEYLYPVGNALSVITGLMNAQYKEWAEEYGYLFVDISNVETGSTAEEVGIVEFLSSSNTRWQGLCTHPTPEGYAQIYRMIEDALVEKESNRLRMKTQIRVNLGRIKSPLLVSVDTNVIKNYTMEDGVITIPYLTMTAKTLTVSGVTSDGKIQIAVYALSYDDGYTAYRLYTTNDLIKVMRSYFSNLVTGVRTLVNYLKAQ